jgi:iron complex outermembrane recepter protein
MTTKRGAGCARLRSFVMALTMLMAVTHAVSGTAQGQSATQRPESLRFDIPAGPLGTALTSFAEAARLKLLAPSDALRGLRSPGISGSFLPEEALRRLLAGTGITYRFTNGDTVTLERGAGSGEVTNLAPVTAEAERETAWSPVKGYVAKRSAAGTKTDTPIIETPQSVTVITRDQLDAQQVQSVSQGLAYTAGVVAQPRGEVNGFFEFPTIRGFGSANFEYLDGMRLLGASSGIQIDPYNLERIDVWKGPASVLYGQSAPTGIVNLISKRPTDFRFQEVELQAGSFDRVQGAFDLGGPIDEQGRFLYRVTGFARDADTQVDFTKDQRISIAPAIAWRPDTDTSLTLLTNYQFDPKLGFFNFLPAQGTFLDNPNGKIPTSFYGGDPSFNISEREQYALGYLFEHHVDDVWTLRQNLRYMNMRVDIDSVFGTGLQANLRTLNRVAFFGRQDIDAYTIDNQAQAKFDTAAVEHTVLVGFDFQKTIDAQRTGTGTAPTIDVFAPVYNRAITRPATGVDTHTEQSQYGLYGQHQIKLGGLNLVYGARQDWATSRTENRLNQSSIEMDDKAITGRAGAIYVMDNGIAPYVSYATSFNPSTGTDFFGMPFEPTTGRQVEIGVKYQPTSFNGLFTVAAFDLAQQNVLTPDPARPNFSIQTGEIRSRGVEFEGKVSLNRNINLLASYTALDPEVTKANPNAQRISIEGKRPVGIPRHFGSVWGDYTFNEGPVSGLGFATGVRYVGWSYGDQLNTFHVPSYVLVDAALHYDFGELSTELEGLRATINATNLLDNEYTASCLNAPGSCFYGLRRNVIGSLKYRW